jgi:hypothetical protein
LGESEKRQLAGDEARDRGEIQMNRFGSRIVYAILVIVVILVIWQILGSSWPE